MTTRMLKHIVLFLLSITVLFILLVGAFAATLDDADYRKIVIGVVGFITGYEVVVDGDFDLELSAEPYLAVSGVRFEPGKNTSRPYVDHIGKLQIQLNASHLFAGKLLIKQLLIDDATVSLTLQRSLLRPSYRTRRKRGLSSVFVPVIEKAVLHSINISIFDNVSDSGTKIELRHLKLGAAGESSQRSLVSEGAVNAQEFHIEGQLGAVAQIFNPNEPYPVLMNAKTANVDLSISGVVDDLLHGEGLDLQLAGEIANLSDTLKLFGVTRSGLGRLRFAADVTGNVASPQVSALDVDLSDEANTHATAKGSVGNALTGEGADLMVAASTRDNDLVRLVLPPIMADFNQLDIKCRLRKRQTDFVFEDVIASGANAQGLNMKAFGGLNFGDLKRDALLKGIDLDLRLDSPTTDAARRFLIAWLPEIGPVHGEGRLQGSMHQLSLEELSIVINDSGPLNVSSQGRIGQIPTTKGDHISELDLAVSIQSEKTKLLAEALDISLPELGSTSARFRVYYKAERLRFDEVDVKALDSNGLEVAFSGAVGEIPNKRGQPYGDVDFRIQVTAPDMGAAKPLLGVRILEDIGPVAGEAQVAGTTDVLSLQNLVITAGRAGGAYLEMRGGIDKIPVAKDRRVTGCSVNGSIHVDEATDLGPLSGLSLSNLGPLYGSWRLIDRNGGFGVDDAKLKIGAEEGFQLEAVGKIDSISRKGVVAVSGVEFDVSASAVDPKTVPILAALSLPDLAPLKMHAKLRGENDRIDIGQMVIHAGPDEASAILVQGDIQSVSTDKRTKITATLETLTRPWAERILQRPVAASHKLVGRLTLVPETDQMQIAKIDIAVDDRQSASLQAKGSLKRRGGSYTMDMQVTAAAEKPSVFGSMFGVSLPPLSPLSASGRLSVADNKTDFEGSVRLGKTVLQTTASNFTRQHKPKLMLSVHSPAVYLSDLGIYPQETAAETEKKQPNKTLQGLVFSQEPLPFEIFKSFDITLGFDADKLVGKNFEINHFDFDLALDDGNLRINPVKLVYSNGSISFESLIKANGPTPEFSIKAHAEDLNVDAFFAYAHRPLILGGQLNLTVDLQGAGRSPHDLVSSLDGELGVAIENGRIKRDIELITADAIDVITSLPKLKDYQDLNCLVVKFTFEKGVGKSNIIFYDTPNVRTSGGGTVNLASETVDIVLQPKPKKGLPELSSAIYLHGTLAKPSIRKMPFKEAARLAGEILMPYVFLPARALGYLWYLLKDDQDEKSPCLIEEPGGG